MMKPDGKPFIEDLVRFLNRHTELYDTGRPEITDEEWDKVYFELVRLENRYNLYLSDSPTQKVNYTVLNELKKVTHNHPLLSLAKTKDWNEFLNYFTNLSYNKDVIGMPKLDGLTGSLLYQNGKLVRAETRGNGEVGEDVTENALVIKNIPRRIDYSDELIIDGEFIITDKDFEPFANEYANSRNLAAGSIRLLNSKECASRNLTFVVWNVHKGFDSENSFMHRLFAVEKLGFTTVPFTSSFDWDAKEFLINKAKKLGYPIDGLVGRFDDIEYGNSLGATGHHSRAAYAFKFYDEEYETSLKDIEWSLGRTSILTPVAIFEPIEIEGAQIERASLHNLSILNELSGGFERIGDKLKIYRANMIIPQVSSWEHTEDYEEETHLSIPEVCPVCGGPTKIVVSDSGVKNLICDNPNCSGKLINKLELFCSKRGLDIRGLSKATLEKLIDWGWVNNIIDLYSLSTYEKEWKKKSGFGLASVRNILNAIENSKNCELHSFITSLGIPLIGSTYAKEIAKKEFDWHNFREDIEGKFDFTKWDSFGPEMCLALHKFDYSEADELVKILNIKNSLWVNPEGKVGKEAKTLDGMKIVITGSLKEFKNRAEAQSAIEKMGGKVVGSVSKNTDFLINNDVNSNSSKNVSAKNLGIPIMTEKDFIKKFL